MLNVGFYNISGNKRMENEPMTFPYGHICYSDLHVGMADGKSCIFLAYEGWNFNSGNYLFTADTK